MFLSFFNAFLAHPVRVQLAEKRRALDMAACEAGRAGPGTIERCQKRGRWAKLSPIKAVMVKEEVMDEDQPGTSAQHARTGGAARRPSRASRAGRRGGKAPADDAEVIDLTMDDD